MRQFLPFRHNAYIVIFSSGYCREQIRNIWFQRRLDKRCLETLVEDYRCWFRAKFFGRFRLFFRYDSRSRIIVYAWVKDERTLRQRGGNSDPYEVFRRMLASGNPPNDGAALVKGTCTLPKEIAPSLTAREALTPRVLRLDDQSGRAVHRGAGGRERLGLGGCLQPLRDY